jgi:hypothetical protein
MGKPRKDEKATPCAIEVALLAIVGVFQHRRYIYSRRGWKLKSRAKKGIRRIDKTNFAVD